RDGTTPPSPPGPGPTFDIRSPRAFAYALSAPGQLGLGRAYVTGEIVPDDMDATLGIVTTWEPPAIDRKAPARLPRAARRGRRGPRARRPPPPLSCGPPGAGTASRATSAPSATTTTSPTS